MAAKPNSKPSEPKEPARKRGKGLWIGAILALLVAAGAGAGWHFTRPAKAADAAETQPPKRADSVFMPLESFTVNLADEGGERLAQVAIVLEVDGKDAQAALGKNLPIVRNSVLLLLSSQHTKTLLTLDGKLALAGEIALRTGTILGWKAEAANPAQPADPARPKDAHSAQANPVLAVHFSQLLVQ